jgi:anaerobic magnesium-protoporphyrin IX monomethyl ester cyclase
MNVLLIPGMGPEVPNKKLLEGSSFEALLAAAGHRAAGRHDEFDLSLLRTADGAGLPLLRPRRAGGRARAVSSVRLTAPAEEEAEPGKAPHLTTFTLQSILLAAGVEHEVYPIERIWNGSDEEPPGDADIVLLSTTFIWDRRTLAKAVA